MRRYQEKNNVQKKAYYNDRFWIAPQLPKESVENDKVFSKDLESLKSKFEIKEAYIQRGQMVVYIDARDNKAVLTHLRDELSYNFLSEMSAIDWLAKSNEFEIFYQMLSTSKRKRMRVKCFIKENEAIESVENIYKSANWAEREMYDMMGVKVNNHSYMKRILMPDDWQGHPLRKSYPLHGDEAAQWYEIDKIFGKDYREIIGPENRDAAYVNERDTKHFARIRHEVRYGEEPSKEPTDLMEYQEEDGVFLIKKLKKDESITLKERR